MSPSVTHQNKVLEYLQTLYSDSRAFYLAAFLHTPVKMKFTSIIVSLLSISSIGSAAPTISARSLTPTKLVTRINQLNKISQKLQPVISAIETGGNGILKRQTNPFQPAIDGFKQIITVAQTDVTAIAGTKPYNAAHAQPVCTAFNNVSLERILSFLHKLMSR